MTLEKSVLSKFEGMLNDSSRFESLDFVRLALWRGKPLQVRQAHARDVPLGALRA